jgi:hypothetical protein
MADKKNPGDPKQPLQEESIVARLTGGSGETPAGVTTYTGLLGRSSREGYWLLYPTLDMSTSLEIQEADIVHSEPLPPEQSPFGGLGGTRVFVRKGAQVTTTRTVSRASQAGGGDEFDLDIQVGGPASGQTSILAPITIEPICNTEFCTRTCNTRCNQFTCNTCPTRCNQATCQLTCTCNTQCNQATCNTCQTRCGQITCIPDPRRTCGQICTRATCFPGCEF